MKKLGSTVTVFLSFIMFDANAVMTGEMRQVFIQSAYASCYENQRAASVNQGISNKSLQQYCKCFVTYLADSINNQLAIEITEGNVKLSTSLVEIATNYCLKHYSEF